MKNKTFRFLLLIGLLVLGVTYTFAQQATYGMHSHNDYHQQFPFWKAYTNGANSIEADVFLKKGTLYVTHAEDEIIAANTIESLYLTPIAKLAKANNLNKVQLLVDVKSDAKATLKALVKVLKEYPELINNKNFKVVISGNRPAPKEYKAYPNFIWFDHQNIEDLDTIDLSKVALVSKSFKEYSVWNGLGRITAGDSDKLNAVITKVHKMGKPMRFWGAPDTKTAWYRFATMGIDFINTDKPGIAAEFLAHMDEQTYTLEKGINVYTPAYDYDAAATPMNIILMIGDGNGLSQITSAMISNGGNLTVTQLKDIGLVKTSSYDDLVTDSAAGGTAMATGKKTNNRAIGTDPNGKPLETLVEYLSAKGYICGLATTDRITGATPSAFYAHVQERDDSKAILKDLTQSNVRFFVAAGAEDQEAIAEAYTLKDVAHFNSVTDKTSMYLSEKGLAAAFERGTIFPMHVKKVLETLETQDKPYFMMIEGAKIDSNGHTNNVKGIVDEMLDFDQTIAEVLKVADANKNTLVIITADHETSGFGIMQGTDNGGFKGGFLTHDHTAVMVPLFAYGPQAAIFRGVYENTEIFKKIVEITE
ncbi:hypothetical protein NBRC110019_15930 [Neptunitalea chrysea]|uniref:Alkaline phosphatase n=1 Tax=Neptunitalea chrysea TaxID=1647581 RepID=A0A9W6EW80_9FLAO|nr:alkaline phosphatase [Neptunitalea chrysea]GLB52553.1 hypothetical protein NBRC110019_15930 [Neptunitalea chrysea]